MILYVAFVTSITFLWIRSTNVFSCAIRKKKFTEIYVERILHIEKTVEGAGQITVISTRARETSVVRTTNEMILTL